MLNLKVMSPSKHIRRIRLRPKKHSREYFIWCDESDQSGKFFSNFYGGVLVKGEDLADVMNALQKCVGACICWMKLNGIRYQNIM
jgi:hypothetical protein